MINEIEIQKLKSEYPEFSEQVSSELLGLIFSEETSSNIAEICLENGVENEEKIEKIAYRIVLALLEQVPRKNLAKILEKGVGIDSETAGKIHIGVNRLIFSQIKTIQPKKTPLIQPVKASPPAELEEKNPKESQKKDIYQEPIE